MRRQFFTLLEVIIAMALVSLLMTMLFSYYAQIESLQAAAAREKEEGFQLRYLQARLATLLPSTISKNGEDFYFYTHRGSEEMASLTFTFDNGVDLDAHFSNHVLARLFLEESQGNLLLARWPVPRCWTKEEAPPMLREVLIDRVTGLDFAFYYPPTPSENKGVTIRGVQNSPTTKGELETNQWYSLWHSSYRDLPAIIKVRIKRSVQTGLTPAGEWIEMAFPIPNAKKPIAVNLL